MRPRACSALAALLFADMASGSGSIDSEGLAGTRRSPPAAHRRDQWARDAVSTDEEDDSPPPPPRATEKCISRVREIRKVHHALREIRKVHLAHARDTKCASRAFPEPRRRACAVALVSWVVRWGR